LCPLLPDSFESDSELLLLLELLLLELELLELEILELELLELELLELELESEFEFMLL